MGGASTGFPDLGSLPSCPMFEVRKPLAQRLRVRTSELPPEITAALNDIENGIGSYTWAFESLDDAESLLRLNASGRLRAYAKPRSIEEAGTHLLWETFGSRLGPVTGFEGEYICAHPLVGPRAGAGSVQSEAPQTIPRADWLKAYGFGRTGVCLARVL